MISRAIAHTLCFIGRARHDAQKVVAVQMGASTKSQGRDHCEPHFQVQRDKRQ